MRRPTALLITLVTLIACPAAARADDLPVGDHNDTVQELDGVDIVREVAEARLSAFDVGVSATGLPTTWCGTATTSDYTASSTFSPSLPQFKVVYAYPADRPNRFAQWQDALQANLSLIEQLVSSQAGSSRAPRFDMGTSCGPEYLDIQTVALPGARASYVQNMGAVENYVKTQLNPSPGGRRNYLIIADTMSGGGLNGIGELYEGSTSSERADVGNVHNNGGLTSVMWAPDGAAPGTNPNGWWPEGSLHEMTHNMGGVQWSAPHTSQPAGGRSYQYSHCWDGRDVMCYQDGPSMGHPLSSTVCAALGGAMPQSYDCGQDDYFNPAPPAGSYLATHWNLYNNVFMADCSTLPANTCLASGPIGPPVNSGLPTVSGSALTGTTLTGTPGTWSPAGHTYAYQWERNLGAGFVAIASASGSTYRLALADAGATLRLRVTAVSQYGSVTAYSAATGTVVARPPVNTGRPTISGAAISGDLLTGTLGTWSPAGTTYAYQWQRNTGTGAGFVDVTGATGSTYRLSVNDRAATLQLRVTATNADGAVKAWSTAFGPIVVPTPVNQSPPTITGAARTGATLTATTGNWNPAPTSFAYQWQRNPGSGFVNIAGATASTYRLGAADTNARIQVRINASNRDAGVNAWSASIGPVIAQPPINTALPRVTGAAVVGSTLTGTIGTWNPAGTSYAYQWQRNPGSGAVNIDGATRSTYKLVAADKNTRLQLRVLATNPDGAVKAFATLTSPITAAAAAATVSAGASSSVRSSGGVAMANATVSAGAAAASAAGPGPRLTVTVRRSTRAHGKLKVIVCPVLAPGGPVQPCAASRPLRGRAVAFKLAAASGRVRISLIRG